MAARTKIFIGIVFLPFIAVLFIVWVPFLLLFAILDLPFQKRRIMQCNDALEKVWLPKEKYVYISFDGGHELASFIKDTIIRRHAEHIVWQEWHATKKYGCIAIPTKHCVFVLLGGAFMMVALIPMKW